MTSLYGFPAQLNYTHLYDVAKIRSAKIQPTADPSTILGKLQLSKNFTVFTNLVYSAGPEMVNLLGNPDAKITVIAPTNRAFENLHNNMITELNKYTAKDIVKFHTLRVPMTVTDMKQPHLENNRFFVETFYPEHLLINGRHAMPILGFPHYKSTVYPVPWDPPTILNGSTPETVNGFRASNGVLHIVNNSILIPGANIPDL